MAGNLTLGYSCCLIAGVGFGINYLPVKGIDTRDGIFFSAVMSVGILLVGVATGTVLSSPPGLEMPKFEPWAAFGGAIWMCGNLMCPYIIKLVGMGLGLTVWDLSNMIMGWFTGQFGLFGVHKEHHARPLVNCIGLGLASASLIFFSLAISCDARSASDAEKAWQGKGSSAGKKESLEDGPASEISVASTTFPDVDLESDLETQVSTSPIEVQPTQPKDKGPWPSQGCADSESKAATPAPCSSSSRDFVIGFGMALFAGVLFGATFDLPTALMQGTFGGQHSKEIMDYVFSHFCGIFAAASAALVVYVAVLRERRYMPRTMILPAIASGVIWAIAQVAWFQANIDLGFAVAFPIIGSLPGMVGLIIGMAFYGEVKSKQARIWAALGMAMRLPGVALIAIST